MGTATSRRPTEVTATSERPLLGGDGEAGLSETLQRFAARTGSSSRWLMRHPGTAVRTILAIRALPALRGAVQDTVEGRAIHHEFKRFGSRRWLLGLTTVLEIPEDAASYREGSSKQTLRRKTRVAQQHGVTWHPVDDADERARLIVLADANERSNVREQYRQTDPHNGELLEFRQWLVAVAADGTPLLLSVTPCDGEWASLRYFRTLAPTEDASAARYWMTDLLVEHLSAKGVRYLIDAAVPHWLPNGLRHFQRMLGFRLVRLQLELRPASAS